MELRASSADGIVWHTDGDLQKRAGIIVAFSERMGGVSEAPYASLDLAAHTGDSPSSVDENRRRLLSALGLEAFRDRLTCAEQVHGAVARVVGDADAGAGAYASGGRPPAPGADALVTAQPGIPLMLFFADCVPVVLVAERSRVVGIAHAGWRGMLAGVVAATVEEVHRQAAPGEPIAAYVGPHIGPCCYTVSDAVLSRFVDEFVTIRRAAATLDLGAAVAEDLTSSGVPEERQCHIGICTAHNTDRFYSYRAEGRTGRHVALVCILPR